MPRRSASSGLFLLVLLLILVGGCDSTEPPEDEPPPSGALFEVLGEASNFETFPEAASRAGLGASPGGNGNATFFIPDDEAFHLMSPETLDGLAAQQGVLRRVLLRHVAQGSFTLEDLSDGETLETAEGTPLAVTVDDEGTVFLEGVRVEEQVGATDRGPVYRVKSVFRNHLTVEERVAASSLLSHASRLFRRSGVSLSQPGTFLIPINRGFELYPGGGVASFDDHANNPLLVRTLQHLVIPDQVLASDELVTEQPLTSQAGDVLRVEEQDDVIDLASGLDVETKEARVLTRDIQAKNGVFHLIERPIQGHLTLQERVDFFHDLRPFATMVHDAGLEETLRQQEGLTVFAPLQVAFDSLETRGVEQLMSAEDAPLQHLLAEFHVSPDDIPSDEFVIDNVFPTLAGEDIDVRAHPIVALRGPTTLSLSAPSDVVDLPAANGRLHLMLSLLNPRSLDPFDQLLLAGFSDFRALVRLTNYEDFVRGPEPISVVAPHSIHSQLFQPGFMCRAIEVTEDHLSTEATEISVNPEAPPPFLFPISENHFIKFPAQNLAEFLRGDPNTPPEKPPPALLATSSLLYLNFETQNGSYIHAAEEQFRYQNRQNLPPC